MLNFAKFRPCLAPLARLRPQRLQEGRAIKNIANLCVSRHEYGNRRLFSSGRFHFASCEDEIFESVGKTEKRFGANQRAQSSTSLNDQVEQECEDEIFSSIGKRFIELRYILKMKMYICGTLAVLFLQYSIDVASPLNFLLY